VKKRDVRGDSRRAVAAAQARGKVRTNPPVPHTPASSPTPEPELGKVFHSYHEERKGTKQETAPPPLRFVPEGKDYARLLPRLREAGRR
jgi:hypothetical protein